MHAKCSTDSRQVAVGFIVEDGDDDETEARRRRKREKRKRPREDREDEGLDEEDLELIGMKPQREETQSKFKRLKRGPREDDDEQTRTGVDNIFADEDEEIEERRPRGRRGLEQEFDDFIEEDEFSDDQREKEREDEEVAPARQHHRSAMDILAGDASGLDEQALEDFRAAFGDGTDYDFALEKEDEAEYEENEKDKHLDLKDVFEPSQLKEKLLTEEDNDIRFSDAPERHQIARHPYKDLVLTPEEFREEARWIAGMLQGQKLEQRITADLREPFEQCILTVLEFLVNDDFEVPFIFSNRKDYLIYTDPSGRSGSAPKQLLGQKDLWAIYDQDLKYRALIERRRALHNVYEELKSTNIAPDSMFEEMLPQTETMDEVQDLHDYLYFQYATQIKDLALTGSSQTNGVAMSQKKAAYTSIHEDIRASKAYNVVRGFGITPTAFARNIARDGPPTYSEDPSESPEHLADSMTDENFPTTERVLRAARAMFAEEIVTNPRFRKHMRGQVYGRGLFDCRRTEKGLRKIDEQHPYYEFKYVKNQDIGALVENPAMFIKMMKAEEEGLVEIKLKIHNLDSIKKEFAAHMKTDNYSDAADAWNKEREDVVSVATEKVVATMGRLVKENIKTMCESRILEDIRDEFDDRIDQAPYQPRGMRKGTTPRVLTLSNGNGTIGKDPIHWTYVSDDGRPSESGTFTRLGPADKERGLPAGEDVQALVDLIERRKPEVIGISGMSPQTKTLIHFVESHVREYDLRGPRYADEDDRDRDDLLEVVVVNDEVARLYHTSEKARKDHPGWPHLTHYCFALARYLQDPIKEYCSLGGDMNALTFDPIQQLLPREKLMQKLETVLVDKVNMVGVDMNEAAADPALANLLPYICGLGPRKAGHLITIINRMGGFIETREQLLVGEPQALSAKVWHNAASFLYIQYDRAEEDTSEYLDNTRIHPEDYDIARKMAADALELDEEDIEAERQEFGNGAILRRLIRENAQDRVNDLVLEEYAEQLEKNLNAKKRSTLETIRAELQEPFEELRRNFHDHIPESRVFTMFTGETSESLQVGMNVPMTIKRISSSAIEGLLDCGMSAMVEPDAWHENPDIRPNALFAVHQTVQARLMSINRRDFSCTVSLREDVVKRPWKRFDPEKLYKYDEWDSRLEASDKQKLDVNAETGVRATRVIKHPLFRAMSSKLAEEYLGSQNRGDLVIRPSSKGSDHLAITWKVADGIFQHVDVLELDKENEFALGKTLRIGGKFNYSDLDELIVSHIRAMAQKVSEMVNNEKFQEKTKAQLGTFLCPPPSNPNPVLVEPQTPSNDKKANEGTRGMANDLHGCEPQTQHVPILPEPRTPRLFPPRFQGGPKSQAAGLVRQGHTRRL
jgi:transcription elongation factor SPT6